MLSAREAQSALGCANGAAALLFEEVPDTILRMLEPSSPPKCACCGADRNIRQLLPVLWPALIAEWGLSASEAEIVERREGLGCTACGVRLRSESLALAVLRAVESSNSFAGWAATRPTLRVLEINGAGELSPWLAELPGRTLVGYPQFDMQTMSFGDESWDLLLHSDTLEHVVDPIQALRECRRVLAPGGAMCFTIPFVPGRLTRRRDGLPPSYHGQEHDNAYLVITEYGADFWTQLLDAGFERIELVALQWPEAVSIVARK